ncbi:hypothetical protein BpHYR1_034475 [Brachionus plicatilis]|uniref:Uncharacterized protein n=1 Tax=Brachionus plicatilis TaxID=10195 RepID=A0A3M7R1M4_BRAPC|nr:hypothetical protein BpHYR1_034475 [Brachionus plicatilis]
MNNSRSFSKTSIINDQDEYYLVSPLFNKVSYLGIGVKKSQSILNKNLFIIVWDNYKDKNFIRLRFNWAIARPQKTGVCWRGCYITPSPWENGSRRSGKQHKKKQNMTYLGRFSVTSRIRVVAEGARKHRPLPRPTTAPSKLSRRIMILDSGIESVALAGAEREVPSVDGAPSELRSTEVGSIGTQQAM